MIWKNMKLRKKLTLIFICVAILQGVVISCFSYKYSTDIIVKNKKEEMRSTLEQINININYRVSYINQLSSSTGTSYIVSDNLKINGDMLEIGRGRRNIVKYFGNITNSFESIANIMIIDRDNILYSSQDYYRIKDFNLLASNHYNMAKQGEGAVVWMGMSPNLIKDLEVNAPDRVISVVTGIYDDLNKDIAGVLVIDLDPDTFKGLLENMHNTYENQYTFILDQRGELICSNLKEDRAMIHKATISSNTKENDLFEMVVGSEPYIGLVNINDTTGWQTISTVPYDSIIAQSEQLRLIIIMVTTFCTILASAIISIIIYKITYSINELSYAMQHVEEDKFKFKVKSNRNDEIGQLASSFNMMIDKINFLINEVYKKEISQKDAEMQALQSQINPHFLYNTLDTINWMLIDKEEYEISNLIIAIGDLMKYCINEDNTIVTLKQEMDHIESYLMIQKSRMESRLEFRISIDEKLEDCKIPKLLIQPIVENAIMHGIEPLQRGGIIEIGVKAIGNKIHINIEDNGIGISENKVTNILDKKLAGPKHMSIGIRNIEKRIKLSYGKEFGVKIKSKEGVGTIVVVKIPNLEMEGGGEL